MTDPMMGASGAAMGQIVQAPMMRGTRGTAIVNATVAVGNLDVPVAFQAALPTTSYSPQVTLEGDVAILGAFDAIIKKGTLTASGCTVTLRNIGLVSIAVNMTIHVLAAY